MSDDYFDCISFKKTKTGKTFAVRLGSAKKRDDGGFNCYLDALPLPGPDGSCQLTIAPRRDAKGAQAPAGRDELEDSIPF
jgi:hypothetical protein